MFDFTFRFRVPQHSLVLLYTENGLLNVSFTISTCSSLARRFVVWSLSEKPANHTGYEDQAVVTRSLLSHFILNEDKTAKYL